MNTYRVWMKNGCAVLVNAETERGARQEARNVIRREYIANNVNIIPAEVLRVDYVTQLNEAQQ